MRTENRSGSRARTSSTSLAPAIPVPTTTRAGRSALIMREDPANPGADSRATSHHWQTGGSGNYAAQKSVEGAHPRDGFIGWPETISLERLVGYHLGPVGQSHPHFIKPPCYFLYPDAVVDFARLGNNLSLGEQLVCEPTKGTCGGMNRVNKWLPEREFREGEIPFA